METLLVFLIIGMVFVAGAFVARGFRTGLRAGLRGEGISASTDVSQSRDGLTPNLLLLETLSQEITSSNGGCSSSDSSTSGSSNCFSPSDTSCGCATDLANAASDSGNCCSDATNDCGSSN